jgi:hypothetical protein
MGNEVYIASDDNQINLVNTDRHITITQPNCNTSINVEQPITSVVEILTGPPGPAGVDGRNAFPFTGSAVITGSLIITGSSVTTLTASAGLFSGSGAELFDIPASAVVGLALNQITTGSVSASVNLGTNAFTVQSGSITFLNITNQGAATITGSLTVSGSSTFTNIGPAIFSGSITQNASTASFGGVVGIGTTSPAYALHNTGTTGLAQFFGSSPTLYVYNGRTANDSTLKLENQSGDLLYFGGAGLLVTGNTTIGNGSNTLSARLGVKGSGTTSSTTSLLVQNSAGTQYFKVDDGGTVYIATSISMNGGTIFSNVWSGGYINSQGNAYTVMTTHNSTGNASFWQSLAVGTTAQPNTAYKLDVSGSGNFTNNLTVTGSIITNSALTASSALINGNVVIRGTASVDVLITNYESSSIIYSSGSTKFGDSLDDTHEFTGSLYITGSTVSLQGGSFSGSGANLFNIPASGITGLNLSQIATGSVSASVSLGTGSFTISSGSSNFLFISSSGNIGIGTTTPTYKLDVNGSGRLYGFGTDLLTVGQGNNNTSMLVGYGGTLNMRLGWGNGGAFIHVLNDSGLYLQSTVNGSASTGGVAVGLGAGTSLGGRLHVRGTGTTSSTTAFLVQNSNASSSLAVLDNGNVGIGTSSPSYKLDVNSGNLRVTNTSAVDVFYTATNGQNYSYALNVQQNLTLQNDGTAAAPLFTFTGATGLFRTSTSGLGITVAGVERMRVTTSGNVGIGTTSPSASLHVVGNTILSGSAGTGSALLVYKSGSTVVDVQGSQGQLFSIVDTLSGSLMSVNDISGLPILEVFSDDRVVMGTYGAPGLTVTGSTVIASGSFSGSFFGNGSGLTNISASSIVGLNLSQIATGSISASVSTGTGSFTVSSGSTSFLFVSSSGNVGIGTTAPAYTLDVNGTTRLNSSATVSSDLSVGLTTAFGRFNVRGADNSSTSRAITVQNQGQSLIFDLYNDGKILLNPQGAGNILVGTITDSGFKFDVNGTGRFSGNVQITGSATNSLLVKGSGATSATTSLLVQNSSNTQLLKLTDDGQFYILANDSILTGLRSVNHTVNSNQGNFNSFVSWNNNNGTPSLRAFNDDGNASIGIGTTVREASAVLFLQSTTRGFLLPRTNLTSNISTPARGLMTYITASATEGIWYYNSGSYQGWTRVLNDTGSQSISGSLTIAGPLTASSAYISGNLTVIGTASFTYTTASIVNIGAATITLNTDFPAVRYGGINVVDSGSFGNSSTGSLLWDSLNNRWIYSNPSGSSYDGGLLISGPRNTSGLGSEEGTTLNALMKGQGGDHITSSVVFEVSGSVGIGTSSPGAVLDVRGSAFRFGNGGTSNIEIFSDGTTSGLQSYNNPSGILIRTLGAQPINFATNTSTTVLTLSGSSVGIGTTTPAYKLDVNGSGRFTTGVVVAAGQRVSLGGSDYGSDALYSIGGGPLDIKAYYYTRFTRVNTNQGIQVIQVDGQLLT